jgi:hypothetical protein
MSNWLDLFREVWLVDFEFSAPPGNRPEPVCLVAREFKSGRRIHLWQDELGRHPAPPYPIDTNSLLVAYYASAEVGCHLTLGWPVPSRILDLYPEFRCRTAGLPSMHGYGLLGALAWHGLDALDGVEKESMRRLVMRGGPWSAGERRAILGYCETDVEALARLLPVMMPNIDLPHALLRGRYMAAAARMEATGVPIDTDIFDGLRTHWGLVKESLIAAVDGDYGVFEGRTFKADRWAAYLERKGIAWPRLDSGNLDDRFANSSPVSGQRFGTVA